MATANNIIIRKNISIDSKDKCEDNKIIRKKIQLKLKPEKNKIIHNCDRIEKTKLILKKKTVEKSPMEQLNFHLDENFKHHLMFIKDSWSEVKHKIRLDTNNQECWWDLELLLKHFAEQLNVSCMSNPSPQWPSNPFNRIPFNKSQLILLGKQIKELGISVNYMLIELFNYLESKLRFLTIDKFCNSFIEYVNHHYHYRIINYKDSQGNYLGYWVKKKDELSLFERRYAEFKLITPREYDNSTDQLVETAEYLFYKDILDSMPEESIDLDLIANEKFLFYRTPSMYM